MAVSAVGGTSDVVVVVVVVAVVAVVALVDVKSHSSVEITVEQAAIKQSTGQVKQAMAVKLPSKMPCTARELSVWDGPFGCISSLLFFRLLLLLVMVLVVLCDSMLHLTSRTQMNRWSRGSQE